MRTVIDLDIHKHPAPDCFAFSSGASLWDDRDTPRTDRPVRFAVLPISGAIAGNPKAFTFRLTPLSYLPR